MANKINYVLLSLIILCSCSKNLPYNLEITDDVDLTYRIQDKSSGVSVLEADDHIGFNETNPKVKRLLKYSVHEIGLVVYLESTNNANYYVIIKPKPQKEQIYSETLFEYHIHNENSYKKLNLNSNWKTILFNPNSEIPQAK